MTFGPPLVCISSLLGGRLCLGFDSGGSTFCCPWPTEDITGRWVGGFSVSQPIERKLVEEFPVISVVKSGPVVLSPQRQVPESCPFHSCVSSSLFTITICPLPLGSCYWTQVPLYLFHFIVSNAISAFATCRHLVVSFNHNLTSAHVSTFFIWKVIMNLIQHSITLWPGYQPQYTFRKTISMFIIQNWVNTTINVPYF